jgi:ABC-2 type transport system ATP-binding protein
MEEQIKPEKSDSLIEVSNLTKRFKKFTAVDNISFKVHRGEIFGFLGPNGAGKSTTIKMLITLLSPTSGKAFIDGNNIVGQSSKVRETIGYVSQMISVDGTLTAYENLMLMARLYDIAPKTERIKRVNEILSFLNLEDHAHALVRTFSGGMIRKMEVGQAMLHHPKVLFLDEPTTGLDPVARQSVWEHLLALRDTMGTTIFFSTHNMEEADEVSDKIAIINTGKIAIIGTPEEIKRKTGKPDASLEDAFIFFTGNKLEERGNFREIRRARKIEQRLG